MFSPSPAQTLFQTEELLQRPLNSTLGARSAKARAQCFHTLKTAKYELATPEGHSSRPPSGCRCRWPMAASPASRSPHPRHPAALLAVAVVSPPSHHTVLSFPVHIRGSVLSPGAGQAQAGVLPSQFCEIRSGVPRIKTHSLLNLHSCGSREPQTQGRKGSPQTIGSTSPHGLPPCRQETDT